MPKHDSIAATVAQRPTGRTGRHAARAFGPAALLCSAFMVGCHRADVAADVHNTTPQPVFVQIFVKGNQGRAATLGASQRLGPGDRALVGPVRQVAHPPGAYVVVDTLPNPGRPVTMDLPEGTSFYTVRQEGDGTAGRLWVEEKR